MKLFIPMVLVVILAACAAQDPQEAIDKELAVRDFIAVRGLEQVDEMRTNTRDSWRTVAGHFLIYSARRDKYLVEFARRCYELDDNSVITPDVRSDPNRMRARFDTIRGCRIHKIYALTDAEVAELSDLGETPGSRN